MRVIEIITQGPQGATGPQGTAGPTGSFDTASFVTTASFNQFTSSYNSGSFTGSFFGTASWSTNAQTASLAPSYVLNSATSSFVQNSQTSSFKGFSSAQTGSIVTGTVNNTFSKALFVSASSYKTDDVPEISARVRRVTGAAGSGSYITRLYWNVTPDIDNNPVLLGIAPTVLAANNSVYFSRNVAIVDATNSTTVTDLAGAYASDFGTNANGSLARSPSNVAIDWTQNGYIVVAIQNGGGGGVGLLDSNFCDLIRIR